jgi:hypothetical protein
MAKKKNLKEKLQNTQKEVNSVMPKTETVVPKTSSVSESSGMLFHKENYVLMGAGIVLILLGFVLMAGGRHPDPNVFDADALYSFRRITLAPILVLLGFAVEGYAILKKPSAQ